MPLSTENLEESGEDPCDVEENFSTKQLFSLAWQIAKGMVIIFVFWMECCWDSGSEYNLERRIQKSIFYKHEIDGINILAVFLDMSISKWLIWKKIFRSTQFWLNSFRYASERKYLDQISADIYFSFQFFSYTYLLSVRRTPVITFWDDFNRCFFAYLLLESSRRKQPCSQRPCCP